MCTDYGLYAVTLQDILYVVVVSGAEIWIVRGNSVCHRHLIEATVSFFIGTISV